MPKQDSKAVEWPKKREECRHRTNALVLRDTDKTFRVCCRACGRYWEIDKAHFKFYKSIGVAEGAHEPVEMT